MDESHDIQGLVATLHSQADRFGPDHPQTLVAVNQLALALWGAGKVDQAIGLLDQALGRLTSSLGPEHPMRVDVLRTFGEIMFEQHHLEQAGVIHREVLECRGRHAGPNHPDSLAAKGDLAAVLFELGQNEEEGWLEQEALGSARVHLGKTHPVTCVLAWNRALSYERCGDLDSATKVIASELAWLLAEDSARLEADQDTIRTLLLQRFNWDSARSC
jgi:hypothetical protein